MREEEREAGYAGELGSPGCQLYSAPSVARAKGGETTHLTWYSAGSRVSTTSKVCVGSRSSASEKSSPAPFANWCQLHAVLQLGRTTRISFGLKSPNAFSVIERRETDAVNGTGVS